MRLLPFLLTALLLAALCAGRPAPAAAAQGATDALASVAGADAPADDIKPIRYTDIIDLVGKSRGKVVVLNFWATWCGPCREEIPELRELRKSYGEDKLVLLGISLDTAAQPVKGFMAKHPFNYPVYLGGRDVVSGYSIMAIPRTVIYDTKGEKAMSHEGYMDKERLSKAVKVLLEEK